MSMNREESSYPPQMQDDLGNASFPNCPSSLMNSYSTVWSESEYESDHNDSPNVATVGTNESFIDIGKIPDIVKDIPKFNGNPSKLMQWLSDVDCVMETFVQFKGTNQFKLILLTIRRKIVGKADEILNTNNASLSWNSMKDILVLHFSDKRDLMTLMRQLQYTTRKMDSIEEFYNKIQELLSLITNCVRLDPEYRDGERSVLKLISNIALDSFIRGLEEPQAQYLRNFKPKSLPQAYQCFIDYQNSQFRSQMTINSAFSSKLSNSQFGSRKHINSALSLEPPLLQLLPANPGEKPSSFFSKRSYDW